MLLFINLNYEMSQCPLSLLFVFGDVQNKLDSLSFVPMSSSVCQVIFFCFHGYCIQPLPEMVRLHQGNADRFFFLLLLFLLLMSFARENLSLQSLLDSDIQSRTSKIKITRSSIC